MMIIFIYIPREQAKYMTSQDAVQNNWEGMVITGETSQAVRRESKSERLGEVKDKGNFCTIEMGFGFCVNFQKTDRRNRERDR